MLKNNKTILVTGGAGRIGSAIAKDLIKKGYNVLLGDIDNKKLLRIKNKLNSKKLEIYHSNLGV